MANQIGNMVNVSEICSLLSGTKMTVNKYLGILRDSFIIYLLKAFSKNKRNEIRYSNKVYFIDVGLRNMVLKTLNLWQERPDIGGINENLIFSELLKKQKLLDEIKYWRTKSKAEVDFIYLRENHIIPVEVKSGSAIIGTFSRSFHSFIQKYKPAKAIFINKDKFGMQKINQTNAYYIPIHWFILYGIELII